MNEDFLAFIWRHQYFDHATLTTQSGEKITVLRPGKKNSDAGPDFIEARLEIDGLLWAGSVEIHVKTSDWNQHGHAGDKAYGSVILHVVWENDLSPDHYPNTLIPVLALKNHTKPGLRDRFQTLLQAINDIPCENQFRAIPEIEKQNMLSRMVIERLEHKSGMVSGMLDRNGGDWDETTWQLLARYFGAKINADSFQNLAERIPLKILLKHRHHNLQLEALLFGTANLIPPAPASGYVSDLRNEYRFLARKYQLENNNLEAIEWKLLRLRPAGFPTVRISQLAHLLQRNGNLFSLITSFKNLPDLTIALKSVQSAYWHTHYHFAKPAKNLVPPMGIDAIHTLTINAVVPVLAAYGFKTDNRHYLDRAIGLLEEIPAENNSIARKWAGLSLSLTSAAASQGATELYHHYCSAKRCLNCQIGNAIFKTKDT